MKAIKLTNPSILAISAVVAVGCVAALRVTTRPVPMSMAEAKQVIEANGLWTYSTEFEIDGAEAAYRRMIVSSRPLSEDESNALMMTHPEHPRWRGFVCIVQAREGKEFYQIDPVPDESFKGFYLFGDVKLRRMVKSCLASNTSNDARHHPAP